jgi:acetyl esterase
MLARPPPAGPPGSASYGKAPMPLDPQIAGILALLDQLGAPPLAEGTPQAARAAFRISAVDLRDPSTLAPVRSTEDATIPGPAGDIPIRIYRPDIDGTAPTIAFFHGGGFVIGDIETHDDQARLICRDAAMVVVSVDYRLAPEHPFPAGFDDCLAATRWVAEHVESLGGDPERIVVGGDSAGANLAAAVALASRTAGPSLAAQFLIYPVVDFTADAVYPSRTENAEGYLLTEPDMSWFHGNYVGDGLDLRDPRLSPLLADDLTGAPAAVVGTAEFDPLRDEGDAYAEALADAGVKVWHHRFDGMIHGFYGLGVHSAGAAAAVSELNAALRDLVG